MTINARELQDSVRKSIATSLRIELQAYSAVPRDERNEYCFFLKPEIATLRDEAFLKAHEKIFAIFNGFDQEVIACSVLPGRYLERHDLMARHYSVINRASRLGLASISAEGHVVLQELLERSDLTPRTVYGGHEFLAEFEYFTPQALSVLHDSIGGHRVDPSVYAVKAVVDGRTVAVLNGFHPLQLSWFYRISNAIVVFVVRSGESWRTIRGDMTGSTLPSKAASGTIRQCLLAASSELGLQISPLKNGVHVSAGPLEAAVEVARYMSDFESKTISLASTTFGQQALDHISEEGLEIFGRNSKVLCDEETTSTFDLTEGLDNSRAIDVLMKCAMTTDAQER